MSKTKLAVVNNFSGKLLLVLFISFLAFFLIGPIAYAKSPAKPYIGATKAADSWLCDPAEIDKLTVDAKEKALMKTSCICRSTPNLTEEEKKDNTVTCGGLCNPNDPKNPLDKLQKRSCVVDGTPNLTEDQVISAEACKKGSESCLKNNRIIKNYIQPIVNFLSALVAVVIVGSIMFAGIQYALAGDKAEAVGAAKKRIATSLMAFLIFILTFAFLQWLIPGGVFSP